MKHLHFYIQSLMLLLALSLAVLIPFDNDFASLVLLIQFVLGSYQLLLSTILLIKLKRPSLMLKTYNYLVWSYFIGWILLGMYKPDWTSDFFYKAYLMGLPWAMAVYFVVVIDDLEYQRKYRL